MVLQEFYFLKGFRNRLGEITLTKTLPENREYPLYIEKVLFLSLTLKCKSKSTIFLYKQLGSGLSPLDIDQVSTAYVFKFFGAQCCLMAA